MTDRSPHVEVLFLSRPIDRWSRKQGWLAYVRCTLDGAAMKPFVLFRQPDRSLKVMALDWAEQPDGGVINVGSRFRGIHIDDPHLAPEAVRQVIEAVLERARAEGFR